METWNKVKGQWYSVFKTYDRLMIKIVYVYIKRDESRLVITEEFRLSDALYNARKIVSLVMLLLSGCLGIILLDFSITAAILT